MVNFSEQHLNRTFSALADPTRRALLARLHSGEPVSVSDLAEPFDMTLPAVMKHLNQLLAAGLVTRTKQGRIMFYRIVPQQLDSAARWLDRQRSFWSGSLDRLEARAQLRAARRRNGAQS